MTNPTASLSIDFQRLSSGDTQASAGATLALDDAKNLMVYGEARTSFFVGETAYLKLHCSETGYSVDCSAGVANRDVADIAYPYEEDLAFPLTRSGNLRQLPTGGVLYSWVGKDRGSPLFVEKNVFLAAPQVAILRVEYKSLGDRLKLLVTKADTGLHSSMDVLVVVHKNGKALASMTVAYENTAIAEPVPVELSVSDFCSDEQVEDVEVFLDGSFVGSTDVSGKIYLGLLIPGRSYALKMVKEGFTDSNLDVLYNDSFIVPKT